jgi:type IV pilus assembly protein PilC
MTLYKYKAKNLSGKDESGTVESPSKEAATNLLVRKQLFVTEIRPASEDLEFKIPFLKPKVNLKDKIIFTEQLAVMIRSGLSIVSALKSLRGETTSRELGRCLDTIIVDVESGKKFSESLAKFPHVFDQIYVSIVDSGEQSGKLEESLKRLATQMDKSYDLVSKVKGALIYPAVVFIALMSVAVFVLVYILPKLKSIFIDSGATMPAITKIIMGLGDVMSKDWPWLLIGLIVLSGIVISIGQTKKGQKIFDTLKLKIPVFGILFKKAYMANFTRTFASLSASGIPVMDIFKTVRTVIPNCLYQEDIDKISKKVENGILISKALHESKLFPSMMGQLALVGEKSGQMSEVFDTLADYYEREVENTTKNLSALIEPVMMIVLGAGIGVLMIAVLQPIYGMVGAV